MLQVRQLPCARAPRTLLVTLLNPPATPSHSKKRRFLTHPSRIALKRGLACPSLAWELEKSSFSTAGQAVSLEQSLSHLVHRVLTVCHNDFDEKGCSPTRLFRAGVVSAPTMAATFRFCLHLSPITWNETMGSHAPSTDLLTNSPPASYPLCAKEESR